MDLKEEKICRLCLKVAESNFEIIDEITRKMFGIILKSVNLDIIKDPIICEGCAEVAEKCFNFKSICIHTEELIFSFVVEKNRATFDLKDICRDEKDIDTVDNNLICRFGLNHLIGSNFVSLDTLMKDVTFAVMLQLLMPEMVFDVIKDPVICTSCRQNLECYIKFAENCLDVEEKITNYIQNEGTPFFAQVKLSEIQRFSFQNIFKTDYTQMQVIKQEKNIENIDEAPSEVYDVKIIKVEEALNIKDEVNFSETACESPSALSVYELNVPCGLRTHTRKAGLVSNQNTSSASTITDYTEDGSEINKKENQLISTRIFKCAKCTYQAKYKGNLKAHMLIHKDITELEMYKCSICTYQAKRKSHIKTHMLIHKDTKEVEMFKCSMCTHETKHKHSLKMHMLIHKDITELKMYKCSICTHETKHMSYLKSHMLIHKDVTELEMHKCSICAYETKQKGGLVKHMLIHKEVTEVKMYKCGMCAYETKRKDKLKAHMLIHKDITEVEMYKCSLCSYETKHKRNLARHVLIHKDTCNGPKIQ